MTRSVGYFVAMPAAGNSVTPPDWCELLSLSPAGLLATLTINFPKNPNDGQEFVINSTQVVTLLTLASLSAQNILNLVTSLAIGISKRWVWNSTQYTWMPG